MKRSRFTEEQIIGVLREQEARMKVAEVCRKHGISEPTRCSPRCGRHALDWRPGSAIGMRYGQARCTKVGRRPRSGCHRGRPHQDRHKPASPVGRGQSRCRLHATELNTKAGTEKHRSNEQRNTVTKSVAASRDATFDRRELGAEATECGRPERWSASQPIELYFAPTRSGKGAGIVIPRCWAKARPVTSGA